MNSNNKAIEEEFFKLLSENDFNLEPELAEIVKFFFSNEDHFTLQDIEKYAQEKGLPLESKSIGQILDLLVDYGFARQRLFEDGVRRYEHLHLNEHHDHFFCIHCKKIIEFSSGSLEAEQDSAAEQYDFHPFWHCLEIYGLCNECFLKTKGVSIPLSFIQMKGKIEIVEIKNTKSRHGWKRLIGNSEEIRTCQRILNMGLIPGTRAKVVSNNLGMIVLEINGNRMALGRGMSQRIMVKLVD